MNTGRATPVPSPIHVLVAGSPDWKETIGSTLESGERLVFEPLERVDKAALENGECLLTDDLSVLSEIDEGFPTLVDVGTAENAQDALAAGATEILCGVERRSVELLEHRIERTVQRSPTGTDVDEAVDPTGEGGDIDHELRDSLERVSDAFISLDDDLEVTYLNDRAVSLLGRTRTELYDRSIFETFPELVGTEFETHARAVMKQTVPRTVEGYLEGCRRWIEARLFPSDGGLSVYVRDVSDRVRRERALAERTERLETLVESAPVVMLALDSDGTFTLSEGRALERIGFEPGEVVGESVFDVFEDHEGICADANDALDGSDVHTRRRYQDRVFETWYRPIFDGGELDRVIGVAVDVTERDQYENTLSSLHEATRHLLTVDSKHEACEYIVEVADDVLDIESVVFRFDQQENELVPESYVSNVAETIGIPTRFIPGSSITWDSFVTGEPKLFDDVRSSPDVFNESTRIRSGMYVPLGDHGVLTAVSTEEGAYGQEVFELAQLFGATAEAAFDRIERTNRLEERESELRRQNVRLERMHRASQLREDIEEHLLRADSRSEIERGVCERLETLEECSFVWIGEPDPGGNRILPRTSAGDGRGYLDETTVTTHDNPATEPTGRAARTGKPIYTENVASELRDGEWRREALSRNFQSIYTVPLVYDEFVYGVLAVYGTQLEAFDETTRSTLAELGETIAYAIDTVRRTGPTAGDRTEVELEIESGSVLNTARERLDGEIRIEGAIAQPDESTVVFVRCVPPISGATIERWDGVEDVSKIVETDESATYQLRLTEEFLGSVVEANGGVLRELLADETGVRATVDIPDSIDVRELVSGIDRRGFSSSMIARREGRTDSHSVYDSSVRNPLFEELTDRQREVVQLAYHGGFFEWPRRASGEEVATALEISPPAFHKHVRAAERKLFASLFDREITTADG